MTKPDIQLSLAGSGRYLTTDGLVTDLEVREENPSIHRTGPELETSRDQIPQAPVPTPFIIDPRAVKTP